MLISFITIVGILLIYWFQYPTIQPDKNKYKNIYNHIKTPLVFLCIVILIHYIVCCSNNKPQLDIDLSPVNF
jgi:hypothetical protein